MRSAVFAGVLALTAACRPQGSELGKLTVIVDPAIASTRPLREGLNRQAPTDNVDTEVGAKREPHGAIHVNVRVVKNEFWFVSRFVLRGEPGHVECTVTSHSAQGDSTYYRWQSRDIRGSMTLNHDSLSDLTGKPLVLHSDVTGMRSGSDVHEQLQIEISESDLR